MTKKKVLLLPGDGIGPEVTAQVRRVAQALTPDLTLDERPFGGASYDLHGTPLTDEDREPWLASLNAELRSRAALGERVVLACSALKQRYRDTLAADIAVMHWVFLDGNADEIAARMRAREGHYMPESLLRSQFDALERPTDAICISVSLTPVEQLQLALASLPK